MFLWGLVKFKLWGLDRFCICNGSNLELIVSSKVFCGPKGVSQALFFGNKFHPHVDTSFPTTTASHALIWLLLTLL